MFICIHISSYVLLKDLLNLSSLFADVPVTLKILSATMSGCSQAQAWQAAVSLLLNAERHTIQLDVVAFNAAMAGCKHSAWEVCVKLLELMLKSEVSPTVVTSAQLVEAFGAVSHWPRGLQCLEETVKPDVVLVNATATASLRGRSWQTALALWADLEKKWKLKMDLVAANASLEAWAMSSWQETLETLHGFPRLSLRPDVISFNTTMHSCLRAGEWPKVFQLLTEMQRRPSFK